MIQPSPANCNPASKMKSYRSSGQANLEAPWGEAQVLSLKKEESENRKTVYLLILQVLIIWNPSSHNLLPSKSCLVEKFKRTSESNQGKTVIRFHVSKPSPRTKKKCASVLANLL